MSAGEHGPVVDHDVTRLAPEFQVDVNAALAECHADGLDAMVYEAGRSAELQALYYARGRTVIPPANPVTYAKSNLASWHGFLLAVDVISTSEGWFNPEGKRELRDLPETDPAVVAYVARGRKWFADVATIFKRHGCQAGADWRRADPPHFQWRGCDGPSPSDHDRELYAQGGAQAVWKALGAM